MATNSITIRYRPVRIGFLVEDGRIDDLVSAAGLNTLLWGGIYNPVIPISRTRLQFAEQLLDLFSVDLLYAVSENEAIAAFKESHISLRDPNYTSEQIFYQDWHTNKNLVWYLDSHNIFNYYWERDLKHNPDGEQSNCLLLRWDDGDPLRSVFSLQYGFFPTEYDLRDDFEHAFIKMLHSREVSLAQDAPLDPEFAIKIDPLALTRSELLGQHYPFRGDGVYFGDEDDFEDLLAFWNLRAAGRDLLFLPRRHMDRLQALTAVHIQKLDERPNSRLMVKDHLSLHHRSATDEEVAAIRESLPTQKTLVNRRFEETLWNDSNVKPVNFHFRWEKAPMSVDRIHERCTVDIQLPEMRFLTDEERGIGLLGQQLVVEVSSHSKFSHPGHVLRVPYIRQLNEFYSREMAVHPWELRVQRDGIAKIIKTREDMLTLYPISHPVLICKLLEFAGMKAKMSQPGLLATKIIEKLDGVDGSRVFKIRGVRELMQGLESAQSVTHGEATKRIFSEGQFEKHEGLYIEPREAGKLTTGHVFDFLLRHGFFRGGLELSCDECNLHNWLSLREIDDEWECEYCGGRNLTALHLRDRGDWRFRKSGLFAKDNNQEGAIPVILTLLVFLRILDMSEFVWTTALELDPPGCETDFCVLNYREIGGIEIAVGECKSRGGQIDQQDVDNLKKIREKLTSVGLECYVTFAKTADEFTPDEVALLAEVADQDIPMILLTNCEMEPYEPYRENKSGLPEKYPHSLGEMARNSMKRYLQREYHPPVWPV